MDNRSQFTFYRSFWEAVKSLPKKDRLPVLEAIISYALYGVVKNRLTKKQMLSFLLIKPDIDKERREALEGRRSEEYKAWRKAVFERDNYTCQICESHGCKLNAHHIKSYAYHPQLRTDIENGVTLCVPCHKLMHRKREGCK
jgi:predicted restriction endonuclease